MAASLFYVYEDTESGSNRRLKGLFPTQALADTEAAGDSTLTANQGAVTIPDDVEVGWIWDTTDDEWRQPVGADLAGVDQAKAAAHIMMDEFDRAFDFINDNRLLWPFAQLQAAVEGIHFQVDAAARIALNSTRTHANRQKFCEESASWPTDVKRRREAVRGWIPSGNRCQPTTWSWVDPETDPLERTDIGEAKEKFLAPTNVEDAPGTDMLIGREWINDIP